MTAPIPAFLLPCQRCTRQPLPAVAVPGGWQSSGSLGAEPSRDS